MEDSCRFGMLRQWWMQDERLICEPLARKDSKMQEMTLEGFWQASLILVQSEKAINHIRQPVAKVLVKDLRKMVEIAGIDVQDEQ
eukprot:2263948-Karenia_brevis.AAC.1